MPEIVFEIIKGGLVIGIVVGIVATLWKRMQEKS